RYNLLMPGRAANMADGWETRRRRGSGHDWMIIRLAAPGELRRMEVDTSHFKGNYPGTCTLDISGDGIAWREILPHTPLHPDQQHVFDVSGIGTHIRFNIFPDGGVSRLHVYGRVIDEGRRALGLRRLNTLIPNDPRARFLSCCCSTVWS